MGRIDRLLRRSGAAEPGRPEYGPKPEVVPEETNYGAEMDAAVEQARRNQRRYAVNPEYDLVRESFDHYHYLLQAEGLHADTDADPIRHLLRSGVNAHDPEINFSMSRYLRRYPQHADGEERSPYLEWLKRGRDAGEIADPADGIEPWAGVLGLEPAQIVDEAIAMREDMYDRLRNGVLGKMYAKAAEVEPLIAETWPATAQAQQLPLRGEQVGRAVGLIASCQADAEWRRARVVMTADTRAGAAEYYAALAGTVAPADVVVIVTGRTEEDLELPDGVRVVEFGQRSYGISQGMQEHALVALLRSFWAEAILNTGCTVLHSAMTTFGKALVRSEHVLLCLLADEAPGLGSAPSLNLRSFYDAIDLVAAVVVVDEDHRDELIEHFQLDERLAARIRLRPELAALVAERPDETASEVRA